MTQQMYLGGTFPLPDESMTVNRLGYGAMQLAGPQVWGPPRDVDEAIAVFAAGPSFPLRNPYRTCSFDLNMSSKTI
jgi:hypothetical protein